MSTMVKWQWEVGVANNNCTRARHGVSLKLWILCSETGSLCSETGSLCSVHHGAPEQLYPVRKENRRFYASSEAGGRPALGMSGCARCVGAPRAVRVKRGGLFSCVFYLGRRQGEGHKRASCPRGTNLQHTSPLAQLYDHITLGRLLACMVRINPHNGKHHSQERFNSNKCKSSVRAMRVLLFDAEIDCGRRVGAIAVFGCRIFESGHRGWGESKSM